MLMPLVYRWPYGALFWLVYGVAFVPEIVLVARLRRAHGGDVVDDRGSLFLILAGVWFAFGAGTVLAFAVPQATFAHGRVAWFWAGTAILVGGSLLRQHCFRVLGRYFTPAVTVQEGQTVIDRGAYRWVRHPSYTGGLLLLLGFGVALTNWLSIALMLLAGGLIYGYRIHVEEQALASRLGEPYREYMARTKRLVPFVL